MTQIPPSQEPPAPHAAPPPYGPGWPGQPQGPWWGAYPPPQRSQPPGPGWIPLKVQVWAAVEIVLGALLIGVILISQASWTTYTGPDLSSGSGGIGQIESGAPWYLTVYAYLAGLLLAVTLMLAIRALLSAPAGRIALLRTSQLAVAIGAVVLAGGYTLMTQIVGWTGKCPGICLAPTSGVSLNTVVSSIAVDVGAGLAAALLPAALWLWCRGRSDAPLAPTPPPNWPQ